LADGNPSREADALLNLAQVCLDAGFPAAALRSYAAILSKPLSPHRMLAGLGGAAIAAAQAGDTGVLARAAAEITHRVRASGLPYESAQSLYQLGIAYGGIGDDRRRDEYIGRARKLAQARGFFELLHKTEPAEVAKATPPRAAFHLTRSSQEVVASISELDVGEAGGLLALSHLS
jgi:hypothetical protein